MHLVFPWRSASEERRCTEVCYIIYATQMVTFYEEDIQKYEQRYENCLRNRESYGKNN